MDLARQHGNDGEARGDIKGGDRFVVARTVQLKRSNFKTRKKEATVSARSEMIKNRCMCYIHVPPLLYSYKNSQGSELISNIKARINRVEWVKSPYCVIVACRNRAHIPPKAEGEQFSEWRGCG